MTVQRNGRTRIRPKPIDFLTKEERRLKEEYSEYYEPEQNASEQVTGDKRASSSEVVLVESIQVHDESDPEVENSPAISKGQKYEAMHSKKESVVKKAVAHGVKQEDSDVDDAVGNAPKPKPTKGKKKAEAACVFKTTLSRLEDLGIQRLHLDITNPELLDFAVSRNFISFTYGGSPQPTFPVIGKAKVAQHGYDKFMFLNEEWNPHAPQQPGFAGLFYHSRMRERGFYGIRMVFRRLEPNAWLYCGNYDLIPATSLTQEEWHQTEEITKSTWCETIFDPDCKWGEYIRRRVGLRMYFGQEPDNIDIEDPAFNGLDTIPSLEDIRRRYDEGLERIAVYAMKCVGYDEAFQQKLKDGFYPGWVRPPQPGSKSKRKAKPKAVSSD